MQKEIKGLLAEGRKLDAVKLYKERTGLGLKDAKDAVEALEVNADPTPPTGIDSAFEAELLSLLGRGEKLAAVKRYRQQTGRPLLESKQAVEALATRHGLATAGTGTSSGGPLLLLLLAAAAIGIITTVVLLVWR